MNKANYDFIFDRYEMDLYGFKIYDGYYDLPSFEIPKEYKEKIMEDFKKYKEKKKYKELHNYLYDNEKIIMKDFLKELSDIIVDTLSKKLIEKYGYSTKTTISVDDKVLEGKMTGNDENWDKNLFYQYFISDDGRFFEAYYEPGDIALENLEYEKPLFVKELYYDDLAYLL